MSLHASGSQGQDTRAWPMRPPHGPAPPVQGAERPAAHAAPQPPARMRIGGYTIDPTLREVAPVDGDAPAVRVTIKAIAVLEVLAAHVGQVVTRDALIDTVWAGTMPTNDVVTQAITQLRKAFGDDHAHPRYLETIARSGYRLIAPVQPWPDAHEPVARGEPGAGVGIAPRPAPRRIDRRLAWLAGGLLLAVALAAATLSAMRLRTTPPARPVAVDDAAAGPQRITFGPAPDVFPAMSPDGAQVVYSVFAADGNTVSLRVQTTAPVPARVLTQPRAGWRDVIPAWSPNGREIAFERVHMDTRRCQVMRIAASGGEPRSVGPCHPLNTTQLQWHPDGRSLVADSIDTSPARLGGIATLSLATGQWRMLRYARGGEDIDMAPVYSPDGRWIAFYRGLPLSDAWVMPAAGGTPRRLTRLRVPINGIAWTPDGKAVVFAARMGGTDRLMQVDASGRHLRDLGVAGAMPSIALRAPVLAFTMPDTNAQLHAVALDRVDPVAPARGRVLFAAAGRTLLPAVSPDGTQLVFLSDRDGRMGLWWARVDQAESLRLIAHVQPQGDRAPSWSDDGTRVLVTGTVGGRPGLFEVEPVSGRMRRLPVPVAVPIQAHYLPDASRVLVIADRATAPALVLYDRRTTPWMALAQVPNVAYARVDATRGRILFTRPLEAGLWRSDLSLAGVRKILAVPDVGGGRRLVVDTAGAWLGQSRAGCGLWRVAIDAPPPARGRCLLTGPAVFDFSVDAARGVLYASGPSAGGSDIGWMPLPARGSRASASR